ncbi:hypothetical protein, partial [Burkholderia metallica]|uniref:hypothetical protein n=1 Tax=Burkholderia metallica TaxID=488729 RepID=UPI001A8C0064
RVRPAARGAAARLAATATTAGEGDGCFKTETNARDDPVARLPNCPTGPAKYRSSVHGQTARVREQSPNHPLRRST